MKVRGFVKLVDPEPEAEELTVELVVELIVELVVELAVEQQFVATPEQAPLKKFPVVHPALLSIATQLLQPVLVAVIQHPAAKETL